MLGANLEKISVMSRVGGSKSLIDLTLQKQIGTGSMGHLAHKGFTLKTLMFTTIHYCVNALSLAGGFL